MFHSFTNTYFGYTVATTGETIYIIWCQDIHYSGYLVNPPVKPYIFLARIYTTADIS